MRFITLVASALAGSALAAPSTPSAPRHMKSYNLPLTWSQFGWLGEYEMGSPPQAMTAFVDWTWISLYTVIGKCLGSFDDPQNCFQPGQIMFNSTESKTFQNKTAMYPTRGWDPNHFFGELPVLVNYASDYITVGPSRARVVIQAADFQFKSPFAFPFDSVFGLSPVFKGNNASYQSPFYQAWAKNQWPSPYIAYHQCYNGSPDKHNATCNGANALQTLGGYNPKLIKGDIHWYSVVEFDEVNVLDFIYAPAIYNYWSAKMTDFSIGDESQPLNTTYGAVAIFDHASYGRGAAMSVNAYQKLVTLANATPITLEYPPNNGGGDFYQVDCDSTCELPDLKYTFAGDSKQWHITPADYVANLGNDTCVLNIRTLGDGDMVIGNFGETFARNKYIIFDFESNRVGIADLQW